MSQYENQQRVTVSVVSAAADLLLGKVLGLQPQQPHELAQALLSLQGQLGDAPQAQPSMHALMR